MNRVRAAGELPSQKHAVYEGKMPLAHTGNDPADKARPKRPCARCGNRFQPTIRRRMLCARCFGLGGGYNE